jgi:predicted nucleic acid-binding protein
MRKLPYLADVNVILGAVAHLMGDTSEPLYQRMASWRLLNTSRVLLHGSDIVFAELADGVETQAHLAALRRVRRLLGRTLVAEESWSVAVDELMARLRRTSVNAVFDLWHYVTACRYRQKALVTWDRKLSSPASRRRIHAHSAGILRPLSDLETPEGVLGMPRKNPTAKKPNLSAVVAETRRRLWRESGGDHRRLLQLCRGRARALGMM